VYHWAAAEVGAVLKQQQQQQRRSYVCGECMSVWCVYVCILVAADVTHSGYFRVNGCGLGVCTLN
jgi:hypothetical protein